jgi:hypothetical protein
MGHSLFFHVTRFVDPNSVGLIVLLGLMQGLEKRVNALPFNYRPTHRPGVFLML